VVHLTTAQNCIHNFVFDLGAVLFEWSPVQRIRDHFKGQWHGFNNELELASHIFGCDDWVNFDLGLMDIDTLVSRSSTRLNIASACLRSLIEPIGEDLQPIESSVQCLEQLFLKKSDGHPVRLFYLSNMPEPYARAIERKHSFFKWFDAGVFSGDVQLAKPDARIYNRLASEHQLDPQNTLFIDDLSLNVQTAITLGWRVIHLEKPETLKTQLSVFTHFIS
jgi:putative hydrolase of the HAD superfamily